MNHVTEVLGDLVEIIGGGTPRRNERAYWGGEIPWATVKDLQGPELLQTAESITDEGVKNSASKVVPAGTVIVATRIGLGKVTINSQPTAINQDLKALLCSPRLFPRYLFYFLQSKASFLASVGQGATVKGITLDVLRSLPVPLPPLSEQKRIAAILDKADEIRRKRQESLRLADQFLRSVFLDMFGDPAVNPQNFPRVTLTELAASSDGIKCGPFGTQLQKHEFTTSGVPLWGIKHVNENFRSDTKEFVSEKKARELASYSLEVRDLVMTRKGTIGNCAVYPDSHPFGIMHSDLLRIRLDVEKALPEFMVWQFIINRDLRHQLAAISGGAIMDGINVSKLKNLDVLLPSLERQQEFVSIVLHHQRLMAKLRDAQRIVQQQMEALSQRAFQGIL